MTKSYFNPSIWIIPTIIILLITTCNKSSTGNDTKEKPEINISINNTDIANGSGDYNFGDITVGNTSDVAVFTIENIGSDSLTLTGNPYVSFSDGDGDNFSVTTQPNMNVSASGTTTFTVTFTPLSEGIKTTTLSVPNNDSTLR